VSAIKDNMVSGASPLFIIGAGRSGTTFLAKLIDSHPDVLYRHEPDSVLVNTQIPFLPRLSEFPALKERTRRYLEQLIEVRAAKVSGQRPIFAKSFRSSLQRRRFLATLYTAKVVEKAAGKRLGRAVSVADCIDRATSGRLVPLIKSVDSPWRTPLFSAAMPELRILHIMRHPCGVINSCLRGIEMKLMSSTVYLRPPFEAGMAEGYPFSLEELEARSYEERAAFFWMICNQYILDSMRQHANYRPVVYERLCSSLEPALRGIFDFAGLAWNSQTATFVHHLMHQEGQEAGYFHVMRSPASAVDKWREQLSPEQIGRIERIVAHSEVGRRFLEGSWDSLS
jgi:hypothetical protein